MDRKKERPKFQNLKRASKSAVVSPVTSEKISAYFPKASQENSQCREECEAGGWMSDESCFQSRVSRPKRQLQLFAGDRARPAKKRAEAKKPIGDPTEEPRSTVESVTATQRLRDTLQQFGFSTTFTASSKVRSQINGQRKKKRTLKTTLLVRTEEDRRRIIENKVSQILTNIEIYRSQAALAVDESAGREDEKPLSFTLRELRQPLAPLFNKCSLLEHSEYRNSTMEGTKHGGTAGCLLRDWSSIPGRETTPPPSVCSPELFSDEEIYDSEATRSPHTDADVIKHYECFEDGEPAAICLDLTQTSDSPDERSDEVVDLTLSPELFTSPVCRTDEPVPMSHVETEDGELNISRYISVKYGIHEVSSESLQGESRLSPSPDTDTDEATSMSREIQDEELNYSSCMSAKQGFHEVSIKPLQGASRISPLPDTVETAVDTNESLSMSQEIQDGELNYSSYMSAKRVIHDVTSGLLQGERVLSPSPDTEEIIVHTDEALSMSQEIQDEELNYSSCMSAKRCIYEVSNGSQQERRRPLLSPPPTDELDASCREVGADAEKQESSGSLVEKVGTPDKSLLVVKTQNVTPMANYSEMDTPQRLRELDKFGLKPMTRVNCVKILEYLYNATHPVVSARELPEPTEMSAVGDGINEDEPVVLERRGTAGKIATCSLPLHIAWHNFLVDNPELNRSILLYEPINLELIHTHFRNLGFKFHVEDIIAFLDRKCVTIRTTQNKSRNNKC